MIEIEGMNEYKSKYTQKKANSKSQNIPFFLNFFEYIKLVKQAGIKSPNQIGLKRDQFQLARYNDIGPYSLGNCRFITQLENQKERNEHFDVSSHFKTQSRVRINNKTHHLLEVKPWESSAKTNNSLEIWKRANECYNWWIKNKKPGYKKLRSNFKFESIMSCRTLIAKFKEGWNPVEDPKWLEWRESCD